MGIASKGYDLSLPHSIYEYLNTLMLEQKKIETETFLDTIFNSQNNLFIMLSFDGSIKKVSSALVKLLDYSEEDILVLPIKHLLLKGNFGLNGKFNNYYFQNIIIKKNKSLLPIKWRLIPDVLEDAYIYIGWEIKPL